MGEERWATKDSAARSDVAKVSVRRVSKETGSGEAGNRTREAERRFRLGAVMKPVSRLYKKGPNVPEGASCFVYCVSSCDGELLKVGSSINPEARAHESARRMEQFWKRPFTALGWIDGDRWLEAEIQDAIGGHPLPRPNGGISPEEFPWSRRLVQVLLSYGFELPEWFLCGPERTTLEILRGVEVFTRQHFAFRAADPIKWQFDPALVSGPDFMEEQP